MDFHQLLAKMQELDSTPAPTVEVQRPVQSEECGMMSSPSMPPEPPKAPPSLSVNLNAHGMDDIEAIMKLISKVNPDTAKADMPAMSAPPSIMSIKPELPPLKMLPDYDSDNDGMPGGEKDSANDAIMKMDLDKDGGGEQPGDMISSLDRDGDGDHDMDDHDLEKDDSKDDEEKKEEYANEPDVEIKSIDYMNNKLAGGMNKPKDTFPKVAGGDNPMQRVREDDNDLKAQIRAELRRRLEEAKGAK